MSSPGGGDNSTVTSTVVLRADVDPYAAQMVVAERQTNVVAGAVDKLSEKLSNLSRAAGHKLIAFSAADVGGL